MAAFKLPTAAVLAVLWLSVAEASWLQQGSVEVAEVSGHDNTAARRLLAPHAKPHSKAHPKPNTRKPFQPARFPAFCRLPKAAVDAVHKERANCYKSAAEFTKKVNACSASATCNLDETCVGKHGFPFYEGKAGRLLEARFNKTYDALAELPKDCQTTAYDHYQPLFDYQCLCGFGLACSFGGAC